MPKKIYIVGCGGVGSWLAPSICLLVKPENVVLIDGDELEKKNLNRQLFEDGYIGWNKANVLAERYHCESMPRWYSQGCMEHNREDWLFCCVDNNPARVAVIDSCDRYGCQAIFAANETTSSEAYYYRRQWKDTQLDPRVYYPEMLIDHSGDPRGESVGCTGEAQENNRQLVSANFSAAALAQNLFVLWALNSNIISRDTMPMMPYKFVQNLSRQETHRIEMRATKKD